MEVCADKMLRAGGLRGGYLLVMEGIAYIYTIPVVHLGVEETKDVVIVH